jgi:AraC-like DNA-binding protein
MPNDKPLTIDFAQQDALKQILPRPPILSSHEAGWEGIHFAHYRQPTHEVPESCFAQHIISIHVGHSPARLTVKGHFQAELAVLVQMSPYYFASLFKQSTGLAPHQYITKCRIERAKQLLKKRELTIMEICQQVGFQSQSHFTRVFRKHTATTPKTYRQLL